ncbi:MAG: MATE family efflux transporter [Ignavibacteriae bacterium]|nr:MATE family efflux transporter [Ignavibacteriota bacterium]
MNKQIFRLAIPNILSNLSVPLLSSVDTAVVGHLDKVSYLGAIAIGSMIFNFVYWAFGFLRMGTTGLTAQSFGKKSEQDQILILVRSIILALSAALLIILLQSLIKKVSFYLIDANYEVEFYAKEYFDIRIYAAPATLALYAFHGWFLGMQNAKYPLILAFFVNAANIFFNLLFIYQFDMKSDGVALGTVIAQYMGLMLAVFLYLKKYSDLKNFLIKNKILDLEPIKKFFKLNFDIFIRTLCLIFTFSFFTAESAEYNQNILAVNTILLQLWMILSYGVDGFAFASESLVGKYFGAGDKQNLTKVIKLSFVWALLLGFLLSITYWLFGKEILMLYTDKTELINLALTFFIWTIIAPLINSFSYIWDGIYIGAVATKPMRNSMLISTLLIFLPFYLLTKDIFGNHALWGAMLFFMAARGITLTLLSKKYIFNRMNLT